MRKSECSGGAANSVRGRSSTGISRVAAYIYLNISVRGSSGESKSYLLLVKKKPSRIISSNFYLFPWSEGTISIFCLRIFVSAELAPTSTAHSTLLPSATPLLDDLISKYCGLCSIISRIIGAVSPVACARSYSIILALLAGAAWKLSNRYSAILNLTANPSIGV